MGDYLLYRWDTLLLLVVLYFSQLMTCVFSSVSDERHGKVFGLEVVTVHQTKSSAGKEDKTSAHSVVM